MNAILMILGVKPASGEGRVVGGGGSGGGYDLSTRGAICLGGLSLLVTSHSHSHAITAAGATNTISQVLPAEMRRLLHLK